MNVTEINSIKLGTRVLHPIHGLGVVQTLPSGYPSLFVTVKYDNGNTHYYQSVSVLELVPATALAFVPAASANQGLVAPAVVSNTRKSRDFVDTEFRDNQVAWLTEAGAVAGTDKWEPFISTMIRKGKVTQAEAETYRKLDNMLRRWKEAKQYNLSHGNIVLSSHKGYKLGTSEELSTHTTPMELAATA